MLFILVASKPALCVQVGALSLLFKLGEDALSSPYSGFAQTFRILKRGRLAELRDLPDMERNRRSFNYWLLPQVRVCILSEQSKMD